MALLHPSGAPLLILGISVPSKRRIMFCAVSFRECDPLAALNRAFSVTIRSPIENSFRVSFPPLSIMFIAKSSCFGWKITAASFALVHMRIIQQNRKLLFLHNSIIGDASATGQKDPHGSHRSLRRKRIHQTQN